METLMTAHILLPAYSRYYDPGIRDEDVLPASLNGALHNRLLRGRMGFNGLIITDSTGMAGFTECIPRSLAVPLCIENGADIFLFFRNLEEDIQFMRQGLERGILSEKRLNEAVKRILALKAKLNLPEKKKTGTLTPPEAAMDVFEAREGAPLAKEIAERGITLVKDTQHLLPLNPRQHKRIFMVIIGDKPGYHNPRGGYADLFQEEMEKRGFRVTTYGGEQPALAAEFERSKTSEIRAKYDVILYFCNVQSSGSDSAVRITWPGLRATIPTLIHDVPTLMVSIDNPYHLLDAPRIPTYVNAYTSEDVVVKTLAEKLTGESPFMGKSPVDAFVGLFNADK
jgi:beta-N-acetylhexosaminidase